MDYRVSFRFHDVSDLKPFGSGQSLFFSEGHTLVAGDNEVVKTTIFQALRRDYENTYQLASQIVPSWLIFLDEEIRLPSGGIPWRPLSLLMQFHQQFFARRDEFESELTKNIGQLLSAKIESPGNKFSTRTSTPAQLQVTLTDDGAVSVDYDGTKINPFFQANGERLVLFLSINEAVRKLLL